ncbi:MULTISPECIES: hypothetical protein [Haloferax]|uniref:Uncharacterized protein n=1 Tax=Haloferax marinum TaxID=2666143 RepID=A0A6A8G933_9EURY|nr:MULTISPECIES: hypothetical protein [Haloferax]KAB1197739.1 hypothetical protein Hfx1150_09470 [Haloferax sp. CBA1150]MRW96793.1 hypothetical protein [Haloferax marinum]
MAQNNTHTGPAEIRDFVAESSTFESEQEVATKSWYLPTHTVENLRSYIVGQYGTPKHIGAFCTRAMRNWMQDSPSDDGHTTWAHLKSDYDYNGVDVSDWNYRNHHDYTEMPKEEKTALGFSAPLSVLEEFTDDLNKNEYGGELANAVEAEMLKLAQIRRMKHIITEGGAERTGEKPTAQAGARKVKVDEQGNRADLSTIRLGDDDTMRMAEACQFGENNELDWKTRRGLLAAVVRGRTATPKKLLYALDEDLGVERTRSKRKDYNAILEQAEKDEEPICIAPAKLVMEEMDTHNLQQTAGLTHRRQPLTFDEDGGDFTEMTISFYNRDRTTAVDMWEDFIGAVCDIGYQLSRVEWNKGDSVAAVYKGKHYYDALVRFLPLIEATKKVAEREQDDEELHALISRGDIIIESLEESLDEVNNYTIGTGSTHINEAYEEFKKRGETPTSLEFNTKGRMKQGTTLVM